MELLDEVDENNELTGKVLDKEYMHDNKIFHREVCAVIVNEENKILLQKRASCKKQKPNMWGFTAGHVDAGENLLDAMAREIKEEIGIEVNKEQLQHITTDKVIEENNNCFEHYYYVKIKEKIEEMKMQEEEVSDLKYITIKEFENIVNNKEKGYTFTEYEGIKNILQYLKNGG